MAENTNMAGFIDEAVKSLEKQLSDWFETEEGSVVMPGTVEIDSIAVFRSQHENQPDGFVGWYRVYFSADRKDSPTMIRSRVECVFVLDGNTQKVVDFKVLS